MRQLHGQLLAWLGHVGALDISAAPQSRLDGPLLRRYIKARLESVSANTVFNNLRMIAMTFKCLAPDRDWSWIYRDAYAPRRREANAARRMLPNPPSAPTWRKALERFRDLAGKPLTIETAVAARDALLIALAIQVGLRRRNLTGLKLEKTFFRMPYGWLVGFEGGFVKNGRPVVVEIRGELGAAVNQYVDDIRPTLVAAGRHDPDGLWVTRHGSNLPSGAVSPIFNRLGRLLSGRRMHPHMVRSMATTTLIECAENGYALASAALAHDDEDTVSLHYDRTSMSRALKEWEPQRRDSAARGLELLRRGRKSGDDETEDE
jgi:integrase